MWIFTKDGFFSVVKDQYCGVDELMVRARVREDLTRFCERFRLDPRKAIKTYPEADYRFRVQVPRGMWVEYVRGMADSIDYPNFKGTVVAKDHDRYRAYIECWQAMYALQERKAKPSGRGQRTLWLD